MIDVEERRKLLDVLGRGFGLAIEDGGGSDLITADMLGNLLERKGFCRFSGEERC